MTMTQEELNKKLLRAAEIGDLAKVGELIGAGAQVDAADADNYGMQPLHWAAQKGHLPMVEFLLRRGAKIDAVDKAGGVEPLHWAAANGHLSVVEFLLREGGSADAATFRNGRRALHSAAERGYVKIVEFLLESGADPMAKTSKGAMPIDFAGGYPEIHAILKIWSDPELLEKMRWEGNARAIRDHWKRMKKHIASFPRPVL